MSAFVGSPVFSGKGLSTTDISSIGNNSTTLGDLLPSSTPSTIANAHLCWVLFNEQFEVVSSVSDPVVSGGGYKSHTLITQTGAGPIKSLKESIDATYVKPPQLVGKFVGRWIPFIGWGILAYDMTKILYNTQVEYNKITSTE